MSEKIRLGKLEDRTLFQELWRAHLTELREDFGAELIPTDRTIEFFTTIFDLYRVGALLGMTLFAGKDAVLMVGEPLTGGDVPFDWTLGRIANGWGYYTRPERRGEKLNSELFEAATKILRMMGFDTVIGTTHVRNRDAKGRNNHGGRVGDEIRGFEDHQMMHVLRLRDSETSEEGS